LEFSSAPNHTPGTRALAIAHPSVRLLQFFLNLRIDIADSDTESIELPVDKELKDSRPAINAFDYGVFLFLEAF
jgi:hypothetical protein